MADSLSWVKKAFSHAKIELKDQIIDPDERHLILSKIDEVENSILRLTKLRLTEQRQPYTSPYRLPSFQIGKCNYVKNILMMQEAETALLEAEEQLHLAVNQAPVLILAVNYDGIITLLEGKAAKLLRIKPAHCIGKSIFSILHDKIWILEAIKTALSGEKISVMGDVSGHWFEAKFNVLKNHENEIIGVLGVAWDVTSRREVEVVLDQSLSLLRSALDSTADGILIVNESGKVVALNEKFQQMWEIPKSIAATGDDQKMLTYALEKLTDPDSFLSKVKELYETPEVESFDVIELKNGRIFERYSIPHNLKGKIIGRVWSFRDVTARVKSERRQRFLAEASAIFSDSLEIEKVLSNLCNLAVPQIADVCSIVLAVEGTVLHRVGFKHFNSSREQLWRNFFNKYPIEFIRSYKINHVLKTGHSDLIPRVREEDIGKILPGVNDPELIDAFRNENILSLMYVPIKAHSRILGVILAGTTKHCGCIYKSEDLELLEDLAGRAGLAVDNARLYENAKNEIRLREELLGIVSHDLKNPVVTIKMNSSLIKRGVSNNLSEIKNSSEILHQVRLIDRAASQMEFLIRDLLDFASIQIGKFRANLQATNPYQIIMNAKELLRTLASEKSIQIVAQIPSHLPSVICDQDRILQVFSNLIGNAIKYTEAGGVITLGAMTAGRELVFYVSDTGCGISKDQICSIFNSYWKVKDLTKKGTGLGLTISKGIVNFHKGKIWVESQFGKGSTFYFSLPLAKSGVNAHAA